MERVLKSGDFSRTTPLAWTQVVKPTPPATAAELREPHDELKRRGIEDCILTALQAIIRLVDSDKEFGLLQFIE